VFGWSPKAFLETRLPALATSGLAGVKFKHSAVAEERRLRAYSIYAHVLALLVLEASSETPQQTVPDDPLELRGEVLRRFGRISFESVLIYAWELGIPVLPLADPGAFHGACLREHGRNIIVLKQTNQSAARWLYDLLHELRHTLENPSQKEWGVVEEEPISPVTADWDEEVAANEYAEDVILAGRSEELERLCVAGAENTLERLKGAVVNVAENEGVEVDALANHMAWRLSEQGQDWWGAAANLQRQDFSPWSFARNVLLARIDLYRLGEFDRDLLLRALSDVEE
jgi:hypothetical protein